MSDVYVAGQGGTPDEQEIKGYEEQSDKEINVTAEESKEQVQDTDEQPDGTESSEGKEKPSDKAVIEKNFKELQKKFTLTSTELAELKKGLNEFGGPEKMLEWARFLNNDPEFHKWVMEKHQKQAMGVSADTELDDETKKALEYVQKIADQVADAKVRKILQERIDPLTESIKADNLEKIFSKLDADVGEWWREYRDEMADISENLPQSVQDNPSYEDMQDLLWSAIRRKGDFEDKAAKIYEQKLTKKKQRTTEKASHIPESKPKKATTLEEAFQIAKKQMG